MRSFCIDKIYDKYIGKNIYKALGSIFPNLSIGNLSKVFRLKDVKVNGQRINKDYILKKNDNVEIYLSDTILFNVDLSLKYIYEDENILAVYKNCKMPSCNENHTYSPSDIFLENLVKKAKGDNIKICHRLDTNTEGIVIFSKNDVAHEEILNAFKLRLIQKRYIAFVYSKPPKSHDMLNAFLLKDTNSNYVKIYDTKVKNSIAICTEYTVLKYMDNTNISILEITLHTGKTHQIRAHMKHIGCPIIGDPKYCSNDINKKFKEKTQCLFAYKYSFNFNSSSALYYLNNIDIQLNEDALIHNHMNIMKNLY